MFPQFSMYKKVKGSVTVSGVAAGGSSKVTITIPGNVVIIGVPKVSTSTSNADVEVVNGGEREFTVRAINLDSTNAQDIVVNYEALVAIGS